MTNGDDQGPKDRGVYGAWKTKVPLGKIVLAQNVPPKQPDPRPTPKNRQPPKAAVKTTGLLTQKQAIRAAFTNNLELIPKIMDREKWIVGAKLMRHWFSRTAFTISSDQTVNTPANEDIVTLKWVLSKTAEFKAAREAYENILNKSDANYKTKNSTNELLNRLQADTAFNLKDMKIGQKKRFNHYPSGSRTSSLHPKHIQSKTVDAGSSGNKLVAALARFNFHLLAQGEVEILDSRRIRVTITGVGVYVRDSYDFTDDPNDWFSQPLGCWDFQKMKYHGRVNIWGSFTILCVSNNSFRTWRTKNKRGGDFRIFTDIRHIDVKPHYSFERQSKFTFAKP